MPCTVMYVPFGYVRNWMFHYVTIMVVHPLEYLHCYSEPPHNTSQLRTHLITQLQGPRLTIVPQKGHTSNKLVSFEQCSIVLLKGCFFFPTEVLQCLQ